MWQQCHQHGLHAHAGEVLLLAETWSQVNSASLDATTARLPGLRCRRLQTGGEWPFSNAL